jgi:hypothetical protein
MRVEWVSESAWNPQNGHREMLATAKKGETSGLSGWFLIDCSLSKSTRTEVGAKYPATSDLP